MWNEDQRKKQGGICASAAVGDALWWFDQHGNRGLVNITDPTREGLITELYPAGGPVPEPATALLLLGALLVRRRRA